MNTLVTSIHHLSIAAPAKVLEQVVVFYEQLLDLRPGYRPDFGGLGGYWLYAGDHPMVHLIEDSQRSVADHGGGAGPSNGCFDHIAFRCQDIEAIRGRLQKYNIHYNEFGNEAVNQWQVFVSDPAGTSVELNFQLDPNSATETET